jgi:hypothetical protein
LFFIKQPIDFLNQFHQALRILFNGCLFAKRLPEFFDLPLHGTYLDSVDIQHEPHVPTIVSLQKAAQKRKNIRRHRGCTASLAGAIRLGLLRPEQSGELAMQVQLKMFGDAM